MSKRDVNDQLRFWTISALLLLLGVCAKLFYIFLMTRRGVGLPYPYDSYLFQPFDRFTDWLITLEWSKVSNPWDVNSPLAKGMPMSPYGPVTFWFLRATSIFGSLLPFFALVMSYVYLNFILLKKSLKGCPRELLLLILFALVVGYYPLHFIIDRGNTAIIGAVLIALIYLKIGDHLNGIEFRGTYCFEALIILLVGTKPTWGLTILSLLLISCVSFFRASILILLIYLIPILFFDVSPMDYVYTVKSVYEVMGGAINFSNDMTAGIVVFASVFKFELATLNIDFLRNIFLIVGSLFMISGLVAIKYFSDGSKITNFFLAFTHLLLCTLLFARPSADYNLLFVLSAFIVLVDLLYENKILDRRLIYLLSAIFFCIGSWFSIYSSAQGSLWIPIRVAGIVCFDFVIIFYYVKRLGNKLTCSNI